VIDVEKEVLSVLQSVLTSSQVALTGQSPLIGHVPDLDSMAVVAILTTLEERFSISIEDDEVDGSSFASVESLTRLVAAKLAG